MSLLSFLKQGRAARLFFHNWRDYEKLIQDEVKVHVLGRERTIKGETEELEDSGCLISRSFVHKCTLPEDMNLDDFEAIIKEGKLTIEAPKRVIKRLRTGSIRIEYV